jgi:hypothetical protein
MFTCGIGNLHVTMYSDAQFAAKEIDLLRIQPPEVIRNGIETGKGAFCVAILHFP